MIDTQDLLPNLVPRCAGLRTHLILSAESWIEETGRISPCAVFNTVGDLVCERVNAGDFGGFEELFEFIESCLCEGSQVVSEAAATCLLENLVNREDVGSVVAHFMGPRSREHCRAWNKFCGTETEGL